MAIFDKIQWCKGCSHDVKSNYYMNIKCKGSRNSNMSMQKQFKTYFRLNSSLIISTDITNAMTGSLTVTHKTDT